jgi:hypothetical protein
MKYLDIVSFSYCGNGPEKLAKAEELFQKYGRDLQAKRNIISALGKLQDTIFSLGKHMTAMDMGKNCSVCAATPQGGCCSAYMGHENNDVLQLLMNMLAGVEVKLVRSDEFECCFLDETGCLLPVKPIFCLNYLCESIGRDSSKQDLKILEEKTALVLGAQLALEVMIITCLQE